MDSPKLQFNVCIWVHDLSRAQGIDFSVNSTPLKIVNATAVHIAIRRMRRMWKDSRIIEKMMLKRPDLDSLLDSYRGRRNIDLAHEPYTDREATHHIPICDDTPLGITL
jgi:hypothetical protein